MNSQVFSRRVVIALLAAALVIILGATRLYVASLPREQQSTPTPTLVPTSILAFTPAPTLALALPASDLGSDTLALLQTTILPARDRIDLAKRLLGATNIPEPPTTPPPEPQIGDVVTFWAENTTEDQSFQVNAELVYKNAHVYMFVEQGNPVDPEAIKRSADNFENIILPKVHEVFGTEWSSGIDGDPHLYILHVHNLGYGTAAFFAGKSEYPPEAAPTSNAHEMFFVNLDAMEWAIGSAYYESVLAHEFQHMVHWRADGNEDTWMGEGLSELAAMIAGYGSSYFAPGFLNAPDLQLNMLPEDNSFYPPHYGAAFLFFAYFYQRYGDQAITTLVRDPANGLEGVENTLEAIGATDPVTGKPVDRVDLFADWLVANLLQDPAVGDGRYAYTFPDMAGLAKASITAQLSASTTPVEMSAPQWGPNYLLLPGGPSPRTYRFSFSGNDTVSIVPAQAHSGQYLWWANRGDESDSRLTRAFDLSGVSSATLTFWTWYYIENLWDYSYVMVSTDDGTTWTPLATPRTTTEDPHGNAYGPAYTGESGGWVEESLDLTPYAGQKILVRFEYITDDAVTQPGLMVDDIRIPEIDYSYDAEDGDDGWVSEGWLRMDNVLPQYFLVQLVQPGNRETPVIRLLGPGDAPQGEWEITVGADQGDAVVVVAGLAPVTTEPALYRYTLAPVE